MHKLQKRLIQLKKVISEHDHHYYVLDLPIIHDYEYDQLFSELIEIETNHPDWITEDSPSQRLGGKALNAFEKGDHRQPMLSLQNSYSPEDILAFDERLKRFLKVDSKIEYLCEPKLDGLAIELIYEKGQLIGALTRGDGFTGEQVLSNVKTIHMIPLKLRTKKPPERLEVRGEILMLKSDFEKLNKSQEETDQNIFANPRNAAAGTIRQLDPAVAASRPLKIFNHSFGEHTSQFKTQEGFFKYIKSLGLPTLIDTTFEKKPLIRLCRTIEEAVDHYHFIDSIRSHLEYNIDGLVIKVNSLELQENLGFIARSPRWASAAKFKPERGETVINNIVIQIGRTGAITPVAIMEPVRVGGVTISHATLHNQDEMKKKDIRVGDAVIVQRAGDVIPEILSVIKEKRDKKAKPFHFPKACPSCKEPLESRKNEVILRCENLLCPAIIKESLKHFVSKKAMNIDRLGDKLIEQFVDENLIYTFSDIYKIKAEKVLEMERQGEKSVNNLMTSIDSSREPKFERFIYALGIRFVGEQTARALSHHFKNIEELINASQEELISIDDVGPKVASSITNYFSRKKHIKEIHKILDRGVTIQYNDNISQTQKLKNLTIAITGTLPINRNEVKNLIAQQGGKTSSSVSKKTDYVLSGEAAGSKLEKAQELGIPILDWQGFEKILNS